MRRFVALLPLALIAPNTHRAPLDLVVPNDNRVAAGMVVNGTVTVRLEAKLAVWRPDVGVDTTATVQVFAEQGGEPRIPGPLIRAGEGAEIALNVRNSLDSNLVIHGLRGGAFDSDTIQLAPNAERDVRFKAPAPGTYLYWGTTTRSPIEDRPWRDSQLTGAIMVDARGVSPDTAERIFVITVLDVFLGDTIRNKKKEDIWELAINGRSWPHTERLEYPVGRPIRWRWLNGGYLPHPMHLHGFHFRVLGKGRGNRYVAYPADSQPMVVTEFMPSGSSYAMEWTPTRAGRWLMHCHMIPHITPFPERPDSVHENDRHDLARHPMAAMSGLVLGITTIASTPAAPVTVPSRGPLRLFVQQAKADSGQEMAHGYVLQRGAEPRRDSVEVPGTPLLLTRGETATITVINRLTKATTVHWHGMELESVFDGVSGWSRSGSAMAPLVAPGDSFTVAFTPPRAGTFIYHTHIDEGPQLRSGMYGAMLVLEPGQRHDPATDLTFIIGTAVVNDTIRLALNGARDASPLSLSAGTTYRLRFINIHLAEAARLSMVVDSVPVTWRSIAKDGADLPVSMQVAEPARIERIGVGETYDFELTPQRAGDILLKVETLEGVLVRTLRVR